MSTDGRTDGQTTWNQYTLRWSRGYKNPDILWDVLNMIVKIIDILAVWQQDILSKLKLIYYWPHRTTLNGNPRSILNSFLPGNAAKSLRVSAAMSHHREISSEWRIFFKGILYPENESVSHRSCNIFQYSFSIKPTIKGIYIPREKLVVLQITSTVSM